MDVVGVDRVVSKLSFKKMVSNHLKLLIVYIVNYIMGALIMFFLIVKDQF